MNNGLLMIVSLSISGTLLIVAIQIIRHILKDKLNYHWQYYIWLLVIARLLLPISPEKNLMNTIYTSVAITQTTDNETIQKESQIHTEQVAERKYESPVYNEYEDNVADEQERKGQASFDEQQNPISDLKVKHNTINTKVRSFLHSTMNVIWYFYLVVALVLFIKKVISYRRFIRYMKHDSIPVEQIELLELLGRLMEKNNIKKHIELYYNENFESPMVIGCIKPILVLPSTSIDTNDLIYTFEHELVHLKRNDMVYKWLLQFILCVHWFNPFIYKMVHEINRICELSCDETIIHSLSKDKKIEYGTMLLHAAKVAVNKKISVPVAGLHTSKELLMERLGAIMQEKKGSKKIKLMRVSLVCFLSIIAILIGTLQIGTNQLTKEVQAKKESSVKKIPNSEIYKNRQYYKILATDGYLCYPYIVEVSWNLLKEKNNYATEWQYDTYKTRKKVAIKNNEKVTVSFSSGSKSYANDKKFTKALSTIFNNIKKNPQYEDFPFTYPLVKRVKKLSNQDYNKLAKEFYDNNDCFYFKAICNKLDKKTIEMYLDKAWTDKKHKLLSHIVGELNQELITKYTKKAYKQNSTELFAMLIDEASASVADQYVKQAYKDNKEDIFAIASSKAHKKQLLKYFDLSYKKDKIDYFCILLDDMDTKTINKYIEKAQKDKKDIISNVLQNY